MSPAQPLRPAPITVLEPGRPWPAGADPAPAPRSHRVRPAAAPLRSGPPRLSIAAAALGLTLAGCGADRAVTGSLAPNDYRQRHPIVLTDAPRTLDVFISGAGGLDPRQRDDVRAFAAEYRRSGKGAIVAQVPGGIGRDVAVQYTLDGIRRALGEGGLPGGHLAVATYAVADPTVAAPIRLTFGKLQAKVASQCGLWPEDLGVSNVAYHASNRSYWNLGCAMQSNIAAQVADPLDLVRGRQEGRPDTIRRTKVIEAIREGKDPSTQYRQEGTKINQSVGN